LGCAHERAGCRAPAPSRRSASAATTSAEATYDDATPTRWHAIPKAHDHDDDQREHVNDDVELHDDVDVVEDVVVVGADDLDEDTSASNARRSTSNTRTSSS